MLNAITGNAFRRQWLLDILYGTACRWDRERDTPADFIDIELHLFTTLTVSAKNC